MKKIIITLSIFLLTLSQVFAYELTQRDNQIIDNIESILIKKIDNKNNNFTAEKIVAYMKKLSDKPNISKRAWVMLEIIIDDIEYEYYLWEYSNDTQMTQSDCYEDEYFDLVDKKCYFNESYYNDSDAKDYSGKSHTNHINTWIDGIEILAQYNIDQNNIILQKWTKNIQAEEIWKIFTSLIPVTYRSDLIEYHVIDDSESDTSAYVEQNTHDYTQWNMTVNVDSFYTDWRLDRDAYATLIHEFAHILTLNKTQIRYVPNTQNEDILQRFEENCQWNFLQEWCLNDDAYLDDFIDIFWPNKQYNEKVRNGEINAYTGNEAKFINDYAATNPGEDIAESFTYYVLKTKPTGDTVADQKLRFFYQYTPLVNLRKQIRGRLEKIGY